MSDAPDRLIIRGSEVGLTKKGKGTKIMVVVDASSVHRLEESVIVRTLRRVPSTSYAWLDTKRSSVVQQPLKAVQLVQM